MDDFKFNASVLIETKKSLKTGNDYTTLNIMLPTGTPIQFMLNQDQVALFNLLKQVTNPQK